MKTPREILLQRHRNAEPQLDAIRRTALKTFDRRGELNEPLTLARVSLFRRFIAALWHELIMPSRRVWAGFACTWVLIAAVNFASSDHQTAAQAKAKPTPVNMMLAWQQQQKLLTELENGAPDVDKPKSVAPKSRSAVQSLTPTV